MKWKSLRVKCFLAADNQRKSISIIGIIFCEMGELPLKLSFRIARFLFTLDLQKEFAIILKWSVLAVLVGFLSWSLFWEVFVTGKPFSMHGKQGSG
jgi:hypothetical protein